MMRLSAAGIAALSLIHAQRFVADRFDGSWWILDEAKWDLIHRLSIEEHRIVLAVIDAQNDPQGIRSELLWEVSPYFY